MTLPLPTTPTEARFWSKVREDESGCWLWTATTSRSVYGYGSFKAGTRDEQAHRFAYEALVGPIPPDLVLDHLCRTRSCVRPQHLEAVTNRVNTLRGIRGVLTTECPQGHEYAGANLIVRKNGRRGCRSCNREFSLKYKAKKRAERQRTKS